MIQILGNTANGAQRDARRFPYSHQYPWEVAAGLVTVLDVWATQYLRYRYPAMYCHTSDG